jgi:hypothetical protein
MKKYSWMLITAFFLLYENHAYSQWMQTSALAGGVVNTFAVSGNTIFAGTARGLFLSTNNGTSWTAVNSGLTNMRINSLAVSGSSIFAGSEGNGVFLSTNDGEHWTAVNSGLTDNHILSLAVNQSQIVFAGTNGGVFHSTNNGVNWNAANAGLSDPIAKVDFLVNFFAVSGSIIFAGTYSSGPAIEPAFSMFFSTNNGLNWEIDTAFSSNWASSLAVNSGNIFAGTYSRGVVLSSNNGKSWLAVNSGLTDTNVRSLIVSGNNIFAGTYTGGVFLSTNNGASWTAAGLKDQSIFSLAVNESYLFAGTTDSIVWRRPLSDFSDASDNDTNSNGSGCGSGAGLALLPPLWFKVQSSLKRKRSSRAGKTSLATLTTRQRFFASFNTIQT